MTTTPQPTPVLTDAELDPLAGGIILNNDRGGGTSRAPGLDRAIWDTARAVVAAPDRAGRQAVVGPPD